MPPSTQNKLAHAMCRTTGAGVAMKRAFSGVTAPPLASADRCTTPATIGTKLSVRSEANSFQDGRGTGDMANGQDRR